MSNETIYLGTGRRKTASARIRLVEGEGKIQVNDKELADYFSLDQAVRTVEGPFNTIEQKGKFDVIAKVEGGGVNGQATACAHGIARALLKFDEELRIPLKKGGHLRRDPRRRERKKAGQPGARKRFQFSKR
ncbi:MAG: 30S ribosomal protein S9 [Verrucomicrobia bacterium]|nr:30S ribosomal protein S9 [Verrucomicrobiota bacterium]MDA1066533.1 30S ribosomal protein S9 [Verrucomicrobiota bacterium]